jgi:very-short-patch-repair endonuclease
VAPKATEGEERVRLEGSPGGKRNAKRLRKEMTPPEIGLWLALRRNEAGLRFRKQHAVKDYVLDFYCAPARLAIEVDGEVHGRGDRPQRDIVRDAWLASQGLRILRYPATEILSNLEDVARQIVAIAVERQSQFDG